MFLTFAPLVLNEVFVGSLFFFGVDVCHVVGRHQWSMGFDGVLYWG